MPIKTINSGKSTNTIVQYYSNLIGGVTKQDISKLMKSTEKYGNANVQGY